MRPVGLRRQWQSLYSLLNIQFTTFLASSASMKPMHLIASAMHPSHGFYNNRIYTTRLPSCRTLRSWINRCSTLILRSGDYNYTCDHVSMSIRTVDLSFDLNKWLHFRQCRPIALFKIPHPAIHVYASNPELSVTPTSGVVPCATDGLLRRRVSQSSASLSSDIEDK